MSAQVQLLRARPATSSPVPPVQPAPWAAGPSSEPQITLSPASPSSGQETAGFLWMLVGQGGTLQRVWLRDPATGLWGVLGSAAATPLVWLSTNFNGAGELYFQTDAQPLALQPTPIVLVMEIAS